jgi:hypothetical protein
MYKAAFVLFALHALQDFNNTIGALHSHRPTCTMRHFDNSFRQRLLGSRGMSYILVLAQQLGVVAHSAVKIPADRFGAMPLCCAVLHR